MLHKAFNITRRYPPGNRSVNFHHCEELKAQRIIILHWDIRGPFEKIVDSTYYSESELCGGVMTVSFSKYFAWEAMHFLQRSTHFSKTRCWPFAATFRRIVEQALC